MHPAIIIKAMERINAFTEFERTVTNALGTLYGVVHKDDFIELSSQVKELVETIEAMRATEIALQK